MHMYLSTKTNKAKKFPRKLDFDAIIKFLRTKGFTEIKDPNYRSYPEYAQNIKLDYPFYIYDHNDDDKYVPDRLYFSIGGTYSKTNPLVIISSIGAKLLYDNDIKYNNESISTDYEIIVDMIINIFDWE